VRSPALAIGWEFHRRHRWGLIALGAYLAVLATIKLVILGPGVSINMDSAERFAAIVVVPLAVTFTYCLAVFTFGLSGDLAARQSMYPARMFTLPVTTAALAGWPMVYGTAAMAVLWAATRLFAVWPSGFDIPIAWPALLAASLLAWTQALTWMPYGLRGVRVIVAVVWLAAIDAVVLVALQYKTHEPVMLAILAPHVPLAYLVARYAVARARRGDVPDWSWVFGGLAGARPARRDRFASPARAQAWFEWRRHGRSLPALVAILLPCELALLWLADRAAPSFVLIVVLCALITPPFMAAFVAATVRTSNPSASDAHGVSPLIATRPLTSAALIAAKLEATVWSTVVTWVLVLAAIAVALVMSGTVNVVTERVSRAVVVIGVLRVVVFALVALGALMATTWKQLVQSLYIGLSGRTWVVKGSVFLTLAVLAAIGPVVQWVSKHDAVIAALWSGLQAILWTLVGLKMIAAFWVATRLHRRRVLSDRTIVLGAACWCVAVLALYALLTWLLFTPAMPRYVLGLVTILAVPLVRLSAAPLALAWNRHR
jgi:hypothetical protein